MTGTKPNPRLWRAGQRVKWNGHVGTLLCATWDRYAWVLFDADHQRGAGPQTVDTESLEVLAPCGASS